MSAIYLSRSLVSGNWQPVVIAGFFWVIFLSVPRAIGADEPPPEHRRNASPDIILGLSTGFVDHFGKTVEIDGISGATTQLKDRDINQPGGAGGVYADFGFVRLGPGDLGMALGFWTSFPDLYFDVGLIPRYRFLLDTGFAAIPRVEPWLGVPLFFSFQETFSSDFYFMLGGALGCDLSLGGSDFVLGLTIYINAADPVPVREDVEIYGRNHKLESRLNAVFALVNFGYRVL